jgi:hypothetical protein
VDAAGNAYVADTENSVLRRVAPTGVTTTLAGTAGRTGTADGTGAGARFAYPQAVALDAAGNLYVADTFNDAIRKVSPAGSVTTLAGTAGQGGSADGDGAAARFRCPRGVAVDAAGNVYVADTCNHTVRRVTPGGTVTTVAGSAGERGADDGSGGSARFNYPHGVAVDDSGDVWVADTFNQAIRRIAPGGAVTTIAGSPGQPGSADGTGPAARFAWPAGVVVEASGDLWVADTYNHTIRRVTPGGEVTTPAGSPGQPGSSDGTGSAAGFAWPAGLAVGSGGALHVADTYNDTVRVVSTAGSVTTLAGTPGHRGGTDGTGAAARFAWPGAAAVDVAGDVYVADTHGSTIRKITPAGVVTTVAGAPGEAGSADGPATDARLRWPGGVAVDVAGDLYVADTYNHTIRKVSGGRLTTLAGSAGQRGAADGTGAAARFDHPGGIAVDGAGNVFVADTGNSTVRRVTPAGVVTTVAARAGHTGSADGMRSGVRFDHPRGVAVDAAGNLYVADTFNSTVRKIVPAGAVFTLAGTAGQRGSADGTGAAASFDLPTGVAVDGRGNVYVADTGSSTVRRVTPAGEVTTVTGTAGRALIALGDPPATLAFPTAIAVHRETGRAFVAVPDAVLEIR